MEDEAERERRRAIERHQSGESAEAISASLGFSMWSVSDSVCSWMRNRSMSIRICSGIRILPNDPGPAHQ